MFFVSDYDKTVQAGQSTSAPSTGSMPACFAKNQKERVTVLNGRPFERTGPPIVLYSDVLGQFLEDLVDQTIVIPGSHYKWTEKFLWAASEFYHNEAQRREVLVDGLAELFGHVEMIQYGAGQYKPAADGTLTTTIGKDIAYRMILEIKNEMCAGMSEPTIQGSLYYHGYWSQNDVCAFYFVID